MAVEFYLDVHVPRPVAIQLRRRAVAVMTAQEDGCAEMLDEELLQRARELGRVLVTQDIRFKALAEKWQREGRSFAGLVFAHQLRTTVGQLVMDLEIISKTTELLEWESAIVQLPM